MSRTNTVARIIEVITIVGAAFAAFLYLQGNHASYRALFNTELDLRQDMLEEDLEDDAARAAHYRRLDDERELSPSEKARLEYLQRQLEKKYRKQEMYEQKQLEIERE